jgi:hypothetical protein
MHLLLWLLWFVATFEEEGEFGCARRFRPLQLASAHRLTTTHLVVLARFPHAQIVRVCPVSKVSCSDIGFLLWLLWFVAPFEEEGESWGLFVCGLFMCGCAHQSWT